MRLGGVVLCAVGLLSFAGALQADDRYSEVSWQVQQRTTRGAPLDPGAQRITLAFLDRQHQQSRDQLALGMAAVACGLYQLTRRREPEPILV